MTDSQIRRNRFGRLRENAARLQAVWDAAEDILRERMEASPPLDDDADLEEIDPTQFRELSTPIRLPAQGAPSIVLKWLRSADGSHSFSMSYPVRVTNALDVRIHSVLEAAHWRYDDKPDWRTGSIESGGLYWHDGSRAEFKELDETLSTLVADVFHTGDAPPELAGHIALHWRERSKQNYVHCRVDDIGMSEQRRYQLGNLIERFDGFRSGGSVTFPQLHSGDIVGELRMAGFRVEQTFSAHEPHYVEISQGWPIRITGMIGDAAWSFEAKDSTWKIQFGGSDHSTGATWSDEGIRPSRPMAFEEAEHLIESAVRRYLSIASPHSL
jgi:hypothetical protein